MDSVEDHIPDLGDDKTTRVIVVGTIAHISTGGHSDLVKRVVHALRERGHIDVEVMSEEEIAAAHGRASKILGIKQALDIPIEMPAYPSFRKSKGEKKRERAFNRRYYGRDF